MAEEEYSRFYIAGNPVRRVVIESPVHPVGFHPSNKMGGLVSWESHIEADAALIMEMSWNITSFEAQPECLQYPTPHGIAETTPDFRIQIDGETIMVECKPDKALDKPELVETFEQIAAAYARKKIRYEVWTASMIRSGHRLATLKLLWRYCRKPLARTSPIIQDIQTMASCLPQTVGDLLGNFHHRADGLRALAHGVHQGLFTVDFTGPFSNETVVSPRLNPAR
ncbi:hypothetical protein ACFSM5_10945 [Lacibacterium aquatile]|uniref:TnsA endonuclease N-terminal domain-containing protein n=1 Tax=Lacibacterium aquatile TaxID=1168082 RepID=A0ABW5DVA5_9PROT